jgi:hypothetical protein
LGLTFAPDLDAGAFETICPAPVPPVAGGALVAAFLGLPLDSLRVSLAMTASCAQLSGNQTTTGAFGSVHKNILYKMEYCRNKSRVHTFFTHQNSKLRCAMRGILLWLIGIPIPVIILLYFVS